MALVAYSDESDISDDEESANLPPSINSDSKSVDDIQLNISQSEESKNGVLFSIPQPHDNSKSSDTQMPDGSDIVDDVPTLKTWSFSKTASESSENLKTQSKKKNKLKFILPSLSEFDDEESEQPEESVKKKFKPSSSGTGLFACLPKPKGVTSLVPQSVRSKPKPSTQAPTSKASKQNPNPKHPISIPKTTSLPTNDSDEEVDSETTDFFSLSTPEETTDIVSTGPALHSPKASLVTTSLPRMQENPIIMPCLPDDQNQYIDSIPKEENFVVDQDALRRLGGRKGEGIQGIIDVKADDALMTREQWVNHALTEEKPQMSFSKKKEGMPSQVQKRKHQITYLAHQAKEREQELMSSWGENRFTKMKTRSKYGF